MKNCSFEEKEKEKELIKSVLVSIIRHNPFSCSFECAKDCQAYYIQRLIPISGHIII